MDFTVRSRLGSASLLAIALVLVAGIAGAEGAPPAPSAQDKALAEALFKDARKLLEAGQTRAACDKLVESHRLDPMPGTMLNLASCEEKLGKTASAWAAYGEAAALAGRAGQSERQEYARAQAGVMEAQLSRVLLLLDHAPPGLTVSLDGRALSMAIAGTAIPVDPGDHALVFTAPGRAPSSLKIQVERGPLTLSVPVPTLTASAPPPPPTTPNNAPLPPPPAPPPVAPEGPSAQRIAGYAVGGVGVVGIVVGSIFGVRTFQKKSEGDRLCTGTPCTAEGFALQSDARSAATVSTIGFAVGLAGVGAGLALIFTAPSATPSITPASARATLWVTPSVGASGAALAAGGAF